MSSRVSWSPLVTRPFVSTVTFEYVPALTISERPILSSYTTMSLESCRPSTKDPLGRVTEPPPTKPGPATISIVIPLKTMFPVSKGSDAILVPS